jgi:hypothetical protein
MMDRVNQILSWSQWRTGVLIGTMMLLSAVSLFGQDQEWDEDGAIQDAEVVIEKDRQITLEKANRGYEKVGPLPDNVNRQPQQYSFDYINYTATPFTPRIRINRIKEQPLPKLYGNYVKGGVGNYGTTYLEGYFNNKRSETHSLGGYIKSLSSSRGPVDKGNSASSDFSLGVEGSYFLDEVTLHGNADYQRQKVFYYGYTPGIEVEKDTIKQIYNQVSIGLGIEDKQKNKGVDFTLDGQFRSFSDEYDSSEDHGQFNFHGTYQLNDNLGFGIKSDIHFSKRSIIGESQNRNLFRIQPYVKTKISDITLEAGLNVVSENDTIENAGKTHVAPVVTATWKVYDQITLYAGIAGDVEFRSWESYVDENPYLGSEVSLSHNIKAFEVHGGLKGSLWESVSFHTALSIGTYDNLAFFATNSSDSTRFDILYDTDNPTLVHFLAEVGYSKVDDLLLNFRADFYGYDTQSLAKAWGRPTYSLKASATYSIYEKIVLGTSITMMGGIKGLNQQSGSEQKLDGIFDLNLSVDYLFSPRFSAFVIGKNIASQEYQQFLNYPSRGINVIGGISYSF